MKENISRDLGEEIILQLRELNKILERIMRERNENDFTHPFSS